LKLNTRSQLLAYRSELVSAGLRALIGITRGRDSNRSIHNWPPFDVDSVRKWFLARGAPGVLVAGEDLGLALWALANHWRCRIPKVYNNLFSIHFFTF
jgi:hypothetical protein